MQYLTFTRPDITYAIQQVCLYMHDPRESHLAALKRLLRYIRGTVDYGLTLYRSPAAELVVYTDADWAGCPDTRRSTSGYAVFLGGNLVSWSSKRQPVVSRSSAEAEYRVVANGVAEATWLRQLLVELHSPPAKSTLVYCDNQRRVPLHQPRSAPADQACGDRPTLCSGPGRHRAGTGSPCTDHLPVRGHLHQGPPLLDLLGVSVQPQHSPSWLVVAAGGCEFLCFSLLYPVLNSAAPVSSDCGGGGVLVYVCWPMYRGPYSGPSSGCVLVYI